MERGISEIGSGINARPICYCVPINEEGIMSTTRRTVDIWGENKFFILYEGKLLKSSGGSCLESINGKVLTSDKPSRSTALYVAFRHLLNPFMLSYNLLVTK